MRVIFVLLVFLFIALLIQANAEKAPKKSSEKGSTKKEQPPASPSNKESSFIEYLEQFKDKAIVFGEKSLVEARKISEPALKYIQPYISEFHSSLEILADQYLAPQHARTLKRDWFNFYGFVVFAIFCFSLGFFIPQLWWITSLKVLQPLLGALGLGIFGTLAALTQLHQDPAVQLEKYSKTSFENLEIVKLAFFATIVFVNLIAIYKRKTSSRLAFIFSVWLIADHFGYKANIAIPTYSIQVLAFFVITLASFSGLVLIPQPTKKVTSKEYPTRTQLESQPEPQSESQPESQSEYEPKLEFQSKSKKDKKDKKDKKKKN